MSQEIIHSPVSHSTQVLMINHVFDPSKATLAHLACALGSMEILTILMRRAANGNSGIWTQKDDEGASEMCVIERDFTARPHS